MMIKNEKLRDDEKFGISKTENSPHERNKRNIYQNIDIIGKVDDENNTYKKQQLKDSVKKGREGREEGEPHGTT